MKELREEGSVRSRPAFEDSPEGAPPEAISPPQASESAGSECISCSLPSMVPLVEERVSMDLLEARGCAIQGWYLYLSEQEQERDERIDQYRKHDLPGWLIAGVEQKFAELPRRVIAME